VDISARRLELKLSDEDWPDVGLRGERLSHTSTRVSMNLLDCLTELDRLD
jgi:hypothetical protein